MFEIPIVLRQVLEPRVGCLYEDVGLVAGAAQHALDAQHFMPDRVAVTKGCENLMNRNCPGRLRHLRPVARLARAAAAAGTTSAAMMAGISSGIPARIVAALVIAPGVGTFRTRLLT